MGDLLSWLMGVVMVCCHDGFVMVNRRGVMVFVVVVSGRDDGLLSLFMFMMMVQCHMVNRRG